MKRFIHAFVFVLSCGMQAQDNLPATVFQPPAANPCNAIDGDLYPPKRIVPYTYEREASIAWQKTTWSDIDLRERMNFPLYFPLSYQPCRISLFQIMNKHILSGEILAFGDESFTMPLTSEQVGKIFRPVTTVTMTEYDAEGNAKEAEIAVIDSVSLWREVIKLRLKEDWYLNAERGTMEVRTVAMAFYQYVEDKDAYKELFWVYFPAARPFLAHYRVFDPRNEGNAGSFDDLFRKRQFASRIVKETNVYDREIAEYCVGLDALLESERIKYSIQKFEHDLWHY